MPVMPSKVWSPSGITTIALIAFCTSAAARNDSRRRSTVEAVEAYLDNLVAGDRAALRAGFSGEPAIDDPLGGRVRGAAAFERFVAERHAWLRERSARVVPVRTTRGATRTIVESVLQLRHAGRTIELPIAVMGDRAADGRVAALRVYHSLWPLEGKHRVRPPLLRADPTAHVTGVVAEYQRALAAGDVEAIVATFEPDGYFREPSGGIYVHRGRVKVRAFMKQILGAGGIGLEHATVADDGTVVTIEFNAVRFGQKQIAPQAGLAVYERGRSGRLAAARIYDDVNVEALAAPTRNER
jgi:hypothetical protein